MEKLDLSKFEAQEQAIDIKYYLVKYWRYWPIYIFFIGLGLLIVFLFHRYSVERFEVKGSVIIKSGTTPEGRVLDRAQIFTNVDNLGNVILLLTSENLAQEALNKLNFDVSYYASTNIKEIELYTDSPVKISVDWNHPQIHNKRLGLEIISLDEFIITGMEQGLKYYLPFSSSPSMDSGLLNKRFRFGEIIETGESKFTVDLRRPDAVGQEISFSFHHPSLLIEEYAEAVTVKPLFDFGSVLEVGLVTKVVEKGRDYVNALMDSFIEYDLREKNRISEKTLKFIDEQLFIIEDSLNSVESRMQNFKVAHRLLNVNSELDGLLREIRSLESHIQSQDFELAYYKSLREYLEVKGADFEAVIAPTWVGIGDPFLNGLVHDLMQLSLERRKLLSVVHESHPDFLKLDEEVRQVRESVAESIRNLIENTENRKTESLDKLKKHDRQFSTLPQAESNYANIFREFKLRENLYTYLLEKRAEAQIARASNVSDNSIVDYAKKGNLTFPKKSRNYANAIGLGFFTPFGFLLLYHYLNNRVRDQIQLKRTLKIPLLGAIGYSDKDTDLLVAEHPRTLVAESFRSIRSALFYVASEKRCKNILVTSSVSGEGKTFVSINIALAMALSGKKTCVMSMDLRKPKLSAYMGLPNKTGLSSYLVGKCGKEEIVHPAQYKDLYLIPSGPEPPNPSELLLKEKLDDLMEHLEEAFDVIVMDSPPIGLVSETMDLLRFSDVNLYIVRQGFTHKNHLLMINDLYANDQITSFYGIFNAVKNRGNGYDFGGYNYGYGYNYSYVTKNRHSKDYYEKEKPPGWFGNLMSKFKA